MKLREISKKQISQVFIPLFIPKKMMEKPKCSEKNHHYLVITLKFENTSNELCMTIK